MAEAHELVGEIAPSATMQIPVDGSEVTIEDQLKRRWLVKRTSEALRIGRDRVHILTVPEL